MVPLGKRDLRKSLLPEGTLAGNYAVESWQGQWALRAAPYVESSPTIAGGCDFASKLKPGPAIKFNLQRSKRNFPKLV